MTFIEKDRVIVVDNIGDQLRNIIKASKSTPVEIVIIGNDILKITQFRDGEAVGLYYNKIGTHVVRVLTQYEFDAETRAAQEERARVSINRFAVDNSENQKVTDTEVKEINPNDAQNCNCATQ